MSCRSGKIILALAISLYMTFLSLTAWCIPMVYSTIHTQSALSSSLELFGSKHTPFCT